MRRAVSTRVITGVLSFFDSCTGVNDLFCATGGCELGELCNGVVSLGNCGHGVYLTQSVVGEDSLWVPVCCSVRVVFPFSFCLTGFFVIPLGALYLVYRFL